MRTILAIPALVALSAFSPAPAQIFNQNLITNPGAEAGEAATVWSQPQIKDVPGWKTAGSFSVGAYNGDRMIEAGNYGPIDRGEKFFLGGAGGGKSTAVQTVDLSAAAVEIDAGRVRFYLGAYLGSVVVEDSKLITLTAAFKDAGGKTLLTSVLKPPTPVETDYSPVIIGRFSSGFLLPNVRSVELVLDLGGPEGDFNSAAADNLSLILNVEPVMGANLVVNGDAETSSANDGRMGADVPVPGWNGRRYFFSSTYDEARITGDMPAPPQEGRGRYLFLARGGDPTGVETQSIDVTLAKDLIDGGGVAFNLSAYLGGYGDSIDTATARVEFLDAAGKELGRAELPVVGLEGRGGGGGVVQKSMDGTVPAKTRVVQVTLVFGGTGDAAFFGYGAADNVSFTLTAPSAGLSIVDNGVVNSATGVFGPVAAGEMVTIKTTGVDLNSAVRMQLTPAGRIATELGGVKLYFDGTLAPLLNVNSSQINAIVPFDVDKKASTQVRVEYKGVQSNTVTMTVAPTSPGLFTQEGTPKGAGLIYNASWTLVSASNAAAKGSVVTILWTGAGQTDPNGVDGQMETQSLPRPKAAVTVKIGGQTADVVYAGAVPYSWAGLMMAQVRIPESAPTGSAVPVTLTAGSATTPDGVTIALK